MKTIRIIKDLYKEEPISTEFIPSGLTNRNTKVRLHDKTVVLREPKIENRHLFDHTLENRILKEVRSIDVPLLYYDEETGIKITQYIENASTFKPEYTQRAALLVKKLHSLDYRCGVSYDITETFKTYKSANPIYDLSPYTHYLEDAKNASTDLVLSHNDLVEGNFLFTDEKDYLIDYEYTSDNDPFFDLMSFITENDIQDQTVRNTFYYSYFERKPSQKELEKLALFESALHVLWCQWACMMFEVHGDLIYKEIADLKYKRLIEFQ